jgi:hypothetical protein
MQISSRTKESSQRALNLAVSELRKALARVRANTLPARLLGRNACECSKKFPTHVNKPLRLRDDWVTVRIGPGKSEQADTPESGARETLGCRFDSCTVHFFASGTRLELALSLSNGRGDETP